MNKHTPVPCWVEVYDNETFIEAKSQTICGQVSNCDARLIAAAHELLAAAVAFMDEANTNQVRAMLRAAIARAKGE